MLGGEYGDGFWKGAAGSYANSWFKQQTGKAPDGSPAKGAPYSKPAGANTRDYDPTRPHMGMANSGTPPDSLGEMDWLDFRTEHSPYLQALARFPGGNAGSVLHDVWATDLGISGIALQLTIPPLFIISYAGLNAYTDQQLLDSALEDAKRNNN
jgi:hypothetical protein